MDADVRRLYSSPDYYQPVKHIVTGEMVSTDCAMIEARNQMCVRLGLNLLFVSIRVHSRSVLRSLCSFAAIPYRYED
jgi:hypothetical protein